MKRIIDTPDARRFLNELRKKKRPKIADRFRQFRDELDTEINGDRARTEPIDQWEELPPLFM